MIALFDNLKKFPPPPFTMLELRSHTLQIDARSSNIVRGGGVRIIIRGKRFRMDGCTRQNSSIAKRAIEKVGGLVLKIPPKSPDLNPIENFFHTVSVR